jgi:glutaredoxin-related protein
MDTIKRSDIDIPDVLKHKERKLKNQAYSNWHTYFQVLETCHISKGSVIYISGNETWTHSFLYIYF